MGRIDSQLAATNPETAEEANMTEKQFKHYCSILQWEKRITTTFQTIATKELRQKDEPLDRKVWKDKLSGMTDSFVADLQQTEWHVNLAPSTRNVDDSFTTKWVREYVKAVEIDEVPDFGKFVKTHPILSTNVVGTKRKVVSKDTTESPDKTTLKKIMDQVFDVEDHEYHWAQPTATFILANKFVEMATVPRNENSTVDLEFLKECVATEENSMFDGVMFVLCHNLTKAHRVTRVVDNLPLVILNEIVINIVGQNSGQKPQSTEGLFETAWYVFVLVRDESLIDVYSDKFKEKITAEDEEVDNNNTPAKKKKGKKPVVEKGDEVYDTKFVKSVAGNVITLTLNTHESFNVHFFQCCFLLLIFIQSVESTFGTKNPSPEYKYLPWTAYYVLLCIYGGKDYHK